MAELHRTVLYDRHVGLGARGVDFGGWGGPRLAPTGVGGGRRLSLAVHAGGASAGGERGEPGEGPGAYQVSDGPVRGRGADGRDGRGGDAGAAGAAVAGAA